MEEQGPPSLGPVHDNGPLTLMMWVGILRGMVTTQVRSLGGSLHHSPGTHRYPIQRCPAAHHVQEHPG